MQTEVERLAEVLPSRVFAKIDIQEGCWPWRGYVTENGYGRIHTGDGRSLRPHRLTYEAVKGPIPEGKVIDHLCRNRSCVNPAHLEAVTQRENILRGTGTYAQNAAKSRCIRGHEFDAVDHRGHRMCSTCRREAGRRYDAARSPRPSWKQRRAHMLVEGDGR